MTKRLTVEAQGTYSYETVKNRPALSDSPSNIGNALIGIAPNFDQKWLAANYKDEAGRYNDWNGNKYRINPYWVINEMSNKSKRDRLMGQGRVYYSFLDCLQSQFQGRVGFLHFPVYGFHSHVHSRLCGRADERDDQ